MAQYDGSIRINTKINTDGIKEGVKEIASELEKIGSESDKELSRMNEYYKKLEKQSAKSVPALKNITEQVKVVNSELNKMESNGLTADNIEAYKRKFDELIELTNKYESIYREFVSEPLAESPFSFENGEIEIKIDYEVASGLSDILRETENELQKAFDEGFKNYNKNMQNFLPKEEITPQFLEQEKHWNQLKTDVEEYSKTLKELQSQGKFFGDEEYDKVYLAWKNATDAVKAYQAELNKQTESGQAKIAEQEAKAAEKREAAQRRAEEQAEKALQKENERIQRQAEQEAKAAAKEAEKQAKIQAEAAEEQRLAQIRDSAVVSNQRIVEAVERRKQLLQEIADMEKVNVGAGHQQWENAQKELSEVNQTIKEYNSGIIDVGDNYKKLGDAAKKSLDKISRSTQKANKGLSSMSMGFKNILKYGFGIRSIYVLVNKLRSAIKEGFSNLYNDANMTDFKNQVDSLKASLLTLKNAFAAAFRPLVETVIPYLQKAIEYLTAFLDKVGQFMAMAAGQKTYTKAIKQTTAALKDQNKAQNRQLSSLDKLNNLTSDKGSGDSSETMFEEVPVDGELPSIFQKIAEYAQQLKDIFMQGFWDGLGDWEYRWESIKESVGSIKDNLIDIWTDPAVLSAQDSYAKSTAYMLGSFVGSTASIGLTIATNIVGGIAKYLEQNKERIKKYLIDMFDIWEDINYLFAELFNTIAYVFETFASEKGQQLTANLIGIFTDAFMGLMELASKLIRDVLNIIIKPFTDNKEEFRTALEGFLGVLSEVAGTIKDSIDETFDKLNEVYDEHFKPFFDSIANGLSDTVGKFMEFWNGSVQPILDEWAAKFDEVWKSHIQPALNKFAELLGKVADLLKVVWENVIKPFIDWIIANVIPVLLPIFKGIGDAAISLFGTIGDVVGGIIDAFSGIIDFLIGVFTGDWEKAWDGIVDAFKSIFNLIPTIVEGIINTAIDIINGIIGGINTLVDKVPAFGDKIPNIPEIEHVSIPRLATGAVIPANREFLAVLGDQKHGTNIEAPLSTIEDAVTNALNKNGGMGGVKEITVRVPVEIDGNVLFEIIRKLDREQFNRTGNPSFQI